MAALTGFLLGATLLSGVDKAAQLRNQGKIARAQGGSEKALFDLNAGRADAAAADATLRGQEGESRQRLGMRQLAGAQRTAFAGQGVDVNTGSATDVVASDQATGEQDALKIRENAWREAHGFSTEASIYRYQGEMAAAAGRNRQRSLNNEAFSTLLTTGGELFDEYGRMRSTTSAPRINRGTAGVATPVERAYVGRNASR